MESKYFSVLYSCFIIPHSKSKPNAEKNLENIEEGHIILIFRINLKKYTLIFFIKPVIF